MIKAVLFDFGGVIVSEGFESWVTKNIDLSVVSRQEVDTMDRKADLGELSTEDYHKFLATVSKRDSQTIKENILQEYFLHETLRDFIEKFREKGIKTGIVSNFPKEWFYELLNKFQLEKLFDVIVVSSEVRLIKPNSDIFQETLKRLQLLPEETVFVDDKKENIDAAEKINIHGVLFTSTENLEQQLHTLGLQL